MAEDREKKQYATAIAHYLEAETLGADAATIHFNLAECYRKSGQTEQAYERYTRLVQALAGEELDNRLDDGLYWQADHWINKGQAEKARPLLDRIVNEMPKSNYRRSASRALERLEEMGSDP